MGSLRYQTYQAGTFLVDQLRVSRVMKGMEHDGGDIILFRTWNDQRVSIHLIESALPVYEIRKTMQENADKQIYTMFVLWANMMLPDHGQHYLPEDWMQVLYTLNGDRIYGYDAFNAEVYVFPVIFSGPAGRRYIEYGTTVRAHSLRTSMVETRLPGFVGSWWVATFAQGAWATQSVVVSTELTEAYSLLGVDPSDDLDTVKKAYRLLARRYHPDSNRASDTTATMQRINEAYARVLAAREEQPPGP